MGLKNLLQYFVAPVLALSLACSAKKQNSLEGFYLTPDTSEVVREQRGDVEVFYARDKILVKSSADYDRVEELAQRHNGEITGFVESLGWYELRVDNAAKKLPEMRREDIVQRAELNYAGKTEGGGGTLDIESLEDFARGFYQIKLPEAYELIGNKPLAEDTLVAVLDNGFDLEHPELESRYRGGMDFGDVDRNPTYADLPESNQFRGHGTAVAGIIAAENNGQDLNGVNPRARILPLKVFSSSGQNHYFAFKVAAGIAYAALQGADTINMSLGWYADERNEMLAEAVEYAVGREVLLVASAGNDNRDAAQHFPSSLEGVLSVGAVTEDDRRADFSNGGSNYSLDDDEKVLALAAPGKDISVVEAGNHQNLSLTEGSGTSFAAPFVSGLDALMKSLDSSLTLAQRQDILLHSADRIGVEYPADEDYFNESSRTWRRVNAYGAVGRALAEKDVSKNNDGGISNDSGNSVEGKIAFASNRDGNWEIYIMNADGSDLANLTNHPAYDYSPAWSPDGSRIAFTSIRYGNREIYIMDADGSYQEGITNNSDWDDFPTWSPDGNKIAFSSGRDKEYDIYVINIDGSNPRNLTNNYGSDFFPAWSPDGNKITFYSERDVNGEIYVMDSDGSNQRNLTNNPDLDSFPAWSPNGSKIAFTSGRDGNDEIYVMDADGSNQVNITNHPFGDYLPSWSSDGSKIAFTSYRYGDWEIYAMNADGSEPVNLTNHYKDLSNLPYRDYSPAWSPDGSRIAFSSEGRYKEIYVMDADGSNRRKLTNNHTVNDFPTWSPDGSKIAFQNGNFEIYVMNADGSDQINITNSPDGDGDPDWSPR